MGLTFDAIQQERTKMRFHSVLHSFGHKLVKNVANQEKKNLVVEK